MLHGRNHLDNCRVRVVDLSLVNENVEAVELMELEDPLNVQVHLVHLDLIFVDFATVFDEACP